ncbi:CatB-related O-acetyltransferase [Motiliproteus sp. SC1-56]|uniref:xenobiotic acyltransferase family protein n=1 Tax=Motiliproteus sp. SC1-56 TaxID=2799565 RepID=UPI001F5CA6CC|nr:CatB-related O-acetyltransferase [Motiliproteus sp. SC1-56]
MLITIKERIKLYQLRRRFPGVTIRSARVSRKCRIEPGAAIKENVQIGKNVSIGAHTYVNPGTRIFQAQIGRYCSISYDCLIGGTDHPTRFLTTSPAVYNHPDYIAKHPTVSANGPPPSIGHDVWVGARAVILNGVKIGTGAVIAAGAVVTRDVEPYAVYGGVPARKISERDIDDDFEFLGQDWVNLDPDRVTEMLNNASKAD